MGINMPAKTVVFTNTRASDISESCMLGCT